MKLDKDRLDMLKYERDFRKQITDHGGFPMHANGRALRRAYFQAHTESQYVKEEARGRNNDTTKRYTARKQIIEDEIRDRGGLDSRNAADRELRHKMFQNKLLGEIAVRRGRKADHNGR